MPGPPAPPPPPPPPPPPGPGAARPPAGKGRGALLDSIEKGARLKKVTQVNDRSAPVVGKVSDGPSAPPMGLAPPVPGVPKPPSGLAPQVPGNRARSNSDTEGAAPGVGDGPPQLAGLFAGGIPKLRKTGGVNTGADRSSPYLSDPETSRNAAPKQPQGQAPKPPGAAPRPPGIAALRDNLRPSSMLSTASAPEIPFKPKPPIGKKPPLPPPTSRKPSGAPHAPPPPPPSTGAPPAPPPPPPASAPIPPARPPPPPGSGPTPPAAPPLPPSSAPRPPVNGSPGPSLAQQAARNAFGRASPSAAPPPPPPGGLPTSPSPRPPGAPPAPPSAPPGAPPAAPPAPPPSAPGVPPPPPSAAPARSNTVRSMLDPGSYTLTNGGPASRSSAPTSPGGRGSGIVPIRDNRWKFQDESQLPKPREPTGSRKMYRAGRGSTVPLDLSALE